MDGRKCIAVLDSIVEFLIFASLSCLFFSFLFLTPCSRAQTTDFQSYFQWMNAVTDDTLTPRMAAHLNAAGITAQEQERVAAILTKFKAEEFGLEASYNNLPSTRAGSNAGTIEFYNRQAALVQSTINKLRAFESFSRLDTRVQHEAANIQVAKVHSHTMLMNVSMGAQMPPPMNPSYSLYHTTAMGPAIAPLTASMLSQSGMGSWNAQNAVDVNTTSNAWNTDSSVAGASIAFDLGTAQSITGIALYLLQSSSYTNQEVYDVWYSDDATSWTVAVSHSRKLTDQGYNYLWFEPTSHRYWQLVLDNTPGPGPWTSEVQLLQPGAILYVTSQVSGTTSCPQGCPGGAVHHGEATNSLGPTVSGPNVSPTTHINVVNSQSQWEPVPDPNPPTTVGVGGKVLCTLAGIIQNLPVTYFDTQRERALTQSYISVIIDANGMHPEAYYCSDSSSPPDWPGPDQAFPFTPSGQVVNIAFLFREYVHGTSPDGIPWLVYYPKFLPHLGIGYYVKNTFWKPDCTNWDLGFRNLPLPVPLYPQP